MYLKKIQKLSTNKINLNQKKYTVIIGANPSKTARSPKLWNHYFKKTKQNKEMIAIDTKKENGSLHPKFLSIIQSFKKEILKTPEINTAVTPGDYLMLANEEWGDGERR